MIRAMVVISVGLLVGCHGDLDSGSAGPWLPWQQTEAPLAAEVSLGAADGAVDEVLRVATFNVALGGDIDGLVRAMSECSALADAHVILVQEIESHPDEEQSRAARLAGELGLGWVYAPARREGQGTHGLALLTRVPLTTIEIMELPRADLGSHSRRRIALGADVDTPAGPVRLINVHLDTRINIGDRILQLRPAILDAPDPVIVAGDFNTNPYLWADGSVPVPPTDAIADTDQAPLLDDYMDAIGFETPTATAGPTWRLGPIRVRLDSIYSRSLEVTSAGVDRCTESSDHWPLWLDAAL